MDAEPEVGTSKTLEDRRKVMDNDATRDAEMGSMRHRIADGVMLGDDLSMWDVPRSKTTVHRLRLMAKLFRP